MASKKRNKKAGAGGSKWHSDLKDETKHSIFGVLFLALALFFTLAGFGKAGIAGTYIYKISEVLFGAGAFLIPTALFLAGVSLFVSIKPNIFSNTVVGVALFLISGLGAADVMFGAKMGGYVGFLVSWPLIKLFDFWVSLVLLTAIFIVSLLIMLNTSISIKIRKKNAGAEDTAKDEDGNILEKIE